MENDKPKIDITISEEHAEKYKDIIVNCFDEFEVGKPGAYVRKSFEELPIEIIIGIGQPIFDLVIKGLIWDMLKLSINKVFKKTPATHILIRIEGAPVVFGVDEEGKVKAVMCLNPEDYKDIQDMDDLYEYIKTIKKDNSDENENKK